MAIEAGTVVARLEQAQPPERRVRVERRGKDRRRPGSRINREAPNKSLLKLIGAQGVALMAAVIAMTVLGGNLLNLETPTAALIIQGGLLGVAILLIAMGSIEQRLIEIRLELMMMNGGRRQGEDRRQADRRDEGVSERRAG